MDITLHIPPGQEGALLRSLMECAAAGSTPPASPAPAPPTTAYVLGRLGIGGSVADLYGVFGSEEAAALHCTDDRDFVMPLPIGKLRTGATLEGLCAPHRSKR